MGVEAHAGTLGGFPFYFQNVLIWETRRYCDGVAHEAQLVQGLLASVTPCVGRGWKDHQGKTGSML